MRHLSKLLLLVMVSSLATCQTTVSNAGSEQAYLACNAFTVISWAHVERDPQKSDTLQTIQEVKQHNAAYMVTCPAQYKALMTPTQHVPIQ